MVLNRYTQINKNLMVDLQRNVVIDDKDIYKLLIVSDFNRKMDNPKLYIIPAKIIMVYNEEELEMYKSKNYILKIMEVSSNE